MKTTADVRDTKLELSAIRRRMTPAEITQGGDGDLVVRCIDRADHSKRAEIHVTREAISEEQNAQLVAAWTLIEDLCFAQVERENVLVAEGAGVEAAAELQQLRQSVEEARTAAETAAALTAVAEAEAARIALENAQADRQLQAKLAQIAEADAALSARASDLAAASSPPATEEAKRGE